MRGSLHCATDDETVRRFGRDDAVLQGWRLRLSGWWELGAGSGFGEFEFFWGHVYGDFGEERGAEVAFAGVGQHGEDGGAFGGFGGDAERSGEGGS
jgi:hypothetical protein